MDFLLRSWRSVHDGNPGFEFSGAHCTTHASLSEIQCLPRQGLGGTMTVRIHVDGRVAQGSLTVFGEGIDRYREYAQDHDYAEAATAMELVEGTITYSVFREVE